MINTRDFLLFVVAVLFLLVSITSIWAHTPPVLIANSLFFTEPEEGAIDYGVEIGSEIPKDRQSIVRRVREKILASTFLEEANPSVAVSESKDASESELTISSETETDSTQVQPLSCSHVSSGVATLQSWPRDDMNWEVSGSQRQLAVVTVENSTSLRFSIPLYPVALSEPTCLNSEIIGITVGGALIFNGDTIVYAQTSDETLIGYALDGFPIYGKSAVSPDQCGGHQAFDGYRYTVDPNRPYMIGCFKAYPQVL